jgi:hypothetical protein
VTRLDLLRRRLRGQRLVGPAPTSPADVVRWLGAVQAQDYRAALWGVGLRTRRATEADVERAIAERAIVRTWPMRGTLHFVAPDDVRWMLRHLAPRVVQRSAGRWRQLGLDAATFARSRRVVERALAGGPLTRPELYQRLAGAGVSPEGQRGIHILGRHALEGLVCVGPHRGRQSTFVLLDDWLPPGPALERDEALAELARRYFTGHGPATVDDFAWWSGLPLGQARAAAELARHHLTELTMSGASHLAAATRASTTIATALLLPAFDEYAVAYRDRSAIVDGAHASVVRGGMFPPVVVLGGRIAGTWRRRVSGSSVGLTAELFASPSASARRALHAAAGRYGRFVGLDASLELVRR